MPKTVATALRSMKLKTCSRAHKCLGVDRVRSAGPGTGNGSATTRRASHATLACQRPLAVTEVSGSAARAAAPFCVWKASPNFSHPTIFDRLIAGLGDQSGCPRSRGGARLVAAQRHLQRAGARRQRGGPLPSLAGVADARSIAVCRCFARYRARRSGRAAR